MNERIKELAELADIKFSMTEFTGCLRGQDFLVTNGNVNEYQLENYTKSIVRECVRIVINNGIATARHDQLVRQDCAKEIKQHFGVE